MLSGFHIVELIKPTYSWCSFRESWGRCIRFWPTKAERFQFAALWVLLHISLSTDLVFLARSKWCHSVMLSSHSMSFTASWTSSLCLATWCPTSPAVGLFQRCFYPCLQCHWSCLESWSPSFSAALSFPFLFPWPRLAAALLRVLLC